MQIISFFSYKGGSGRTSLLYNLLPLLAKELHATEEEPIVVLDFDIDSKGLSYLFNNNYSKINTVQVLSLEKSIDFAVKKENIHEHPFFRSLLEIGREVGLPIEDKRSILLVSAPKPGDDTTINRSSNYDAYIDLEPLKKLCANHKCKALIFDNPAGDQLSGKSAMRISEKIITVMRITTQFREGTYEFLKKNDKAYNGKDFIIIPNAVPNDEGTEFNVSDTLASINYNSTQCVSKGTNTINTSMLTNGNRGVNEVNILKFEETNLYNRKYIYKKPLKEDEENALQMYEKIVKEIVSE